MQLLSAIFVAIAAHVAVVSATPSQLPGLWCNYGTHGDGGCEANNLHTYCCAPYGHKSDYFPIWRHVTVTSSNGAGGIDCDHDGIVYCA
ncbi:hypothetical protein E4U58_001882 [Claviceps cyperi]|nr:hypothetical protein E4U58_001882 [Claviceps cyperi]